MSVQLHISGSLRRLRYPAVLRPVRPRAHLRSRPEEDWLQGWNATTNHTDVGLDRRPNPQVEAFPGHVIRVVKYRVYPVGTEAAGDNDDASDTEENHEADSLRRRQGQLEQDRHWKDVDDEISDDVEDRLGNERRAFRDAVSIGLEKVPITADWTNTS